MSKLILVGAGPGDPELITLKAIRALQVADVVLYDALANEELLVYANKARQIIFVGKRYGRHALSQQEINNLITDYATICDTIVRLKGGDPFVFGRVQEEIEAAVEAGMEVEVVPGISSALAVPASAMIPLTCRGIHESFWVITGTTRQGGLPKDIYHAARSSAVIIILMAMNRLQNIMGIFTQNGKADTPVAIIQNGTLPNARIVTGKVKDIYLKAQHAGLTNPAVIIIGEVVDLNCNQVKKEVVKKVKDIVGGYSL